MNKLVMRAFSNSLGVAVYIVIVALIIKNGEGWFEGNQIYGIIGVLTLMTLSAAIVGSLIFTKPVMLYLDNEKKSAVYLLIYTIAALAIFLAIYLLILALV